MLKKLSLNISAICLVSTSVLAQTETTPPPWFDTENNKTSYKTDNALPQVKETNLLDPDIRTPASRLESFYRTRTKDQTLIQFGYTLFEGNDNTNNSTPSGAVQDDYILGTGDELLISFTGQKNDQVKAHISPQGQIIIKDFPPIPAAGRSIAALRKSIESYTQNLPNTQAYVSLSSIKQVGVLIVGHVNEPGKKTLNAFNTVFDALRFAGGIQKQGSLRQIKLVRGGLSTQIDLYELLMDGAPGKDLSLRDGDRIIVPPIGATIAATGSVKRPGIYELQTTKTNASLSKLLKYSGGVLSPGRNRYMKHSPSNAGEEVIQEISNLHIPQFKNGAILNVSRGTDKLYGGIELSGHTDKPGLYDIKKYEYLSDLLKNNGALGSNIYPLIGIIKRQNKTLLTKEYITFSPQIVLERKNDIKLQQSDKILLLSNEDIKRIYAEINIDTKKSIKQKIKPQKPSKGAPLQKEIKNFLREQTITLRGAVRTEGFYPIAKHTPLNVLLATAGGTTRQSNLQNIEITTSSPDNAATYRTTLNIDPHHAEYVAPSEVTLSPGDAVRVNQNQKTIKNNVVLIIGEVKHPGEYDLLPGDNVSSLLERAGGLTDHAYPMGSIFSRESARKTEELRYRNTARDLEQRLASAIESNKKDQPNETQIEMVRELSEELSTIQAVGRITVEVDPDILEIKPELDMLLENGDKIYIPKRPLTVRVAGEVFSPAALQFRSDKDPRDYINEAGGFTKAADKNRAFVLYPNGSAQPLKVNAWNHTPIMIPPGSTIVIPLDPKPFNFLHSAKEIGQIIGNLAVTAVFIDDIRD